MNLRFQRGREHTRFHRRLNHRQVVKVSLQCVNRFCTHLFMHHARHHFLTKRVLHLGKSFVTGRSIHFPTVDNSRIQQDRGVNPSLFFRNIGHPNRKGSIIIHPTFCDQPIPLSANLLRRTIVSENGLCEGVSLPYQRVRTLRRKLSDHLSLIHSTSGRNVHVTVTTRVNFQCHYLSNLLRGNQINVT